VKDHITREQFLLEFFGNFGRDLGDPTQWFTDNPMDIFSHVEKCAKEKKPAFISVQPMSAYQVIHGFEKIFYDFDYGTKSDVLSEQQIKKRRKEMENEVKAFLYQLSKMGIQPLVVKTRKGYHVYIYFDRIYEIDNDIEFWRGVYTAIHKRFLTANQRKYKYVDTTSKADVVRLCRIPMSIHQKDGSECIVLNMKLKPTKLRSIEYFKMYGLKQNDLTKAVEWVRVDLERRKKEAEKHKKDRKENWEIKHGFTGQVRPCFKVRMNAGEMCHQQRLALLIEAYYAGHKTREDMVEFFRPFNDFDGDNPSKSTCRIQVKWFFENKVDETKERCKTKPYRCSTIEEYKWCLFNDCPIYVKRKARNAETKRKKA